MSSPTPTTAYTLLTERERECVDEYLEYIIDMQRYKRERIVHALKYPIDPQYLKRSKGLLNRALVRAALAEKIKEAADEQDLSPSRVIAEHASIAFSNLKDYLEANPFGDFTLKDISQIPDEKMAAVKSIKTRPTMNGIHTEIQMHDKLQSLKILAELMGLVAPDKPPVLEDYATPVKSEEEILEDAAPEELYQQLLENM